MLQRFAIVLVISFVSACAYNKPTNETPILMPTLNQQQRPPAN
ncbi:hypothetical protein [Oceanicoccus sp. KOV_DT_Chl]|nr:hypothetical protein [Oceanicoccus sp. KOV_DT_Chl]